MNRFVRALFLDGSGDILGADCFAAESDDYDAVYIGMRAVADKDVGSQFGVGT